MTRKLLVIFIALLLLAACAAQAPIEIPPDDYNDVCEMSAPDYELAEALSPDDYNDLRISERLYYEHRLGGSWPTFVEIDGVLYYRSGDMGGGPPFSPQINSEISKEPDRIVVMAYMLNRPPLPPTPAELVIIREYGRWLLDDTLQHRPQ